MNWWSLHVKDNYNWVCELEAWDIQHLLMSATMNRQIYKDAWVLGVPIVYNLFYEGITESFGM